jgi:hypothetical protein
MEIVLYLYVYKIKYTLISIFRKNLFINSLLLLPYVCLLRLKSFFLETPYIASGQESYITKTVLNLFNGTISQAIVAIFIVFVNALMINRMGIKNNLSKDNNLVSGVIYGLFSSLLLSFLPLSPALLATPFILLSVQSIFSSYNNLKASDEIFLSGFYMSVASLFYFPLFYFFIFTFTGFVIMRSFTFKERIQHIVGWIVPLFLVNSWQYFVTSYPTDFPAYFYNKIGINLVNQIAIGDIIAFGFTIIILIICLLSFGVYMSKKVIASQKRVSILYWMLLIVGLTSFFYSGINMNHLHLLAIPISIFITMNLMEMKNQMWPEIIHLLFILLLVIVHLDLVKL